MKRHEILMSREVRRMRRARKRLEAEADAVSERSAKASLWRLVRIIFAVLAATVASVASAFNNEPASPTGECVSEVVSDINGIVSRLSNDQSGPNWEPVIDALLTASDDVATIGSRHNRTTHPVLCR